jgi:predicted small metal-binding protein
MSHNNVCSRGGDVVSKGMMKMFTCPACRWTVKTPWGEDDLMEHSMMHAKKHHPDMVNTPQAELKKMIKDV